MPSCSAYTGNLVECTEYSLANKDFVRSFSGPGGHLVEWPEHSVDRDQINKHRYLYRFLQLEGTWWSVQNIQFGMHAVRTLCAVFWIFCVHCLWTSRVFGGDHEMFSAQFRGKFYAGFQKTMHKEIPSNSSRLDPGLHAGHWRLFSGFTWSGADQHTPVSKLLGLPVGLCTKFLFVIDTNCFQQNQTKAEKYGTIFQNYSAQSSAQTILSHLLFFTFGTPDLCWQLSHCHPTSTQDEDKNKILPRFV